MRVFWLFLFTALLFFGCETQPSQSAQDNSKFTYNGIGAAYAKVVFDAYYHAWEPSKNVVITNPITSTRVTIARDGEVMSAKILKSSGDEQMDKSVQKALDSVKSVQPFESSTEDTARTFIINFNLVAYNKRSVK
jgi:TonB family protein